MVCEHARIRDIAQSGDIILTDAMGGRYNSGDPVGFIRAQFGECHAQLRQQVQEALVIDRTELDDARWFTRAEVEAALRGDEGSAFLPPPRFAIARTLLDHWTASQAP